MPVLKIYKPIGKTPLDMIHFIKDNYTQFKDSKMSYAGRLDPMAHGLLIILTDEDCKNQHMYHNLDKSYTFELLIGVSTDTYDILGLITQNCKKHFNLNMDLTIKTIKGFEGKQKQYYPPFSSQRINGKPLWYYAKNNLMHKVIVPSKNITIENIQFLLLKNICKNEILDKLKLSIKDLGNTNNFRQEQILKSWNHLSDINYYSITLSADVTSGTYIRTLCNDIGNKLNIPCLALDIYRDRIHNYYLD